jgi:type VI secretion system protein ImpI/type VI secretion system protein
MQLTMTVLRCPDTVVPETRSVFGGELTVGRGPGVDWVLPDPERVLSKRHFVVAYRGGVWQLADTSSNGTFLNRESDPIGASDVRTLRDGDRVRAGAYEIEMRLTDTQSARPGAADSSPFNDPFALDPFAPSRSPRNPFDEPDRPSLSVPQTSARLPHDFDPLASDAHDAPFPGPTQADHSPVMQDAFRPPAQIGQMPLHVGGVIPGDHLLPDDWDKDLLDGIAPGGNAPAPPPRAAAPQRPAAPPERPEPSPPAQPEAVADDGALLAAFLEGVGLRDVHPADPPATMLALGKAFRNLVSGLRAVLIARAQIKSEFRIEQTMIQARGNNPLKFSAGDDDALAALLGSGRRTDMAPHEAVADALRDIRLHELASIAAMQSAVRTLLDGLSPAKLRAQVEQGGGMSLLPAQKKARAWDAYETLYARTVQALADDFDSVFGKAFARAYERSLREVAARQRE